MKSEIEIEQRLEAIGEDKRYHYPCATVLENAPLALIQTALQLCISAFIMQKVLRLVNRLPNAWPTKNSIRRRKTYNDPTQSGCEFRLREIEKAIEFYKQFLGEGGR